MTEDKKQFNPKTVMGRGGHMGGPAQKPHNFKKAFRATIRHLRPFWAAIIFVIICAIISTTFAIVAPKILGNMTTEIVNGFFSPLGINFDTIAKIGWTLISIYILSSIFSYIQSWLMTKVSQRVTYSLRRDVSQKIPRLPLHFFDTHETGNVVSHITNDIETISQNLNQSLIQIITSVTTVIGILVMMLTISWQMTLIAIAVLPVSLILASTIAKKSQRHYKGQQEAIGEIDGYIDEMFSNHVIVKTFNGENVAVKKFDKMNSQLFDSSWKAQFLSGLMLPVMQVVGNLSYVGVAVVGGWMAINGKISIGDIQAFIQYMNAFTQPIAQTANIASIFQNTIAAAERVFVFLDEAEEKAEIDTVKAPKPINGEVLFSSVNFSYVPGKQVINNFDANIRPKHNIAIVGPTGAGKTTVVNLLMRFYDINCGTITIDGIDTSQMKRTDVRKLFGMVLQDTWLFEGTVAENIAYSKPGATHGEIVACCQSGSH